MGNIGLHDLELIVHEYVILFHMQVLCVCVCVCVCARARARFCTGLELWLVWVANTNSHSSSKSVGDQTNKLLLNWSVQYKTTNKLLHSAIRICR